MYEVVDAAYVLRILWPELREVFGGNTVGSRPVGSEKVMPKVYGVLHSRWRGRKVKVMVVERVRHTMRSWFSALMAVKHEPGEIAVRLVFAVTANLFKTILDMADGLLLHFSDLTLDRVGVRESGVTSSRKGGTQN